MKTQVEMRRDFWRNKYGCEPPAQPVARSRPDPTVTLVGLLPAWTLSRSISENGKTFLEQVAAGTFRKTLESKANVTLRVGHDGTDIASVQDGTLDLFDSAEGLAFKAKVNGEAVERALDDNGVGISPYMRVNLPKDKWAETPDGKIRTIQEADLLHLAIVPNPAFSANWVAREGFVMRSLRATSAPRFDAASNALRREAILRLRAEQIGIPRFTERELRLQAHRELCAAVWRNNHRGEPLPVGFTGF